MDVRLSSSGLLVFFYTMLFQTIGLFFAVLSWLARPGQADHGACANLTRMGLANTTITSAQVVPPGGFRLSSKRRRPSVEIFTGFDRLQSFCRVRAMVTPSRDSRIRVEVWMPVSDWNGKYLGVGNGGYAGSISYFRLGEAVNSGYASASTDTGHEGSARESSWSEGHPEKQVDFDYRAVHEMTVVAKAAIAAFYRKAPDHSYFSSCSNGGRQGLMEAERFPADYDGIMAGAPAYHWGFDTFVSGKLDAFRQRGGKLVIYHGSADAPAGTLGFYRQLVARLGQNAVDQFVRLYIVRGMRHCGGGEVPNDFGQWVRPNGDAQHSMLIALERWVETGTAPRNVIATQWRIDGDTASGVSRTVPLCAYPTEARWTGLGDRNSAANYGCEVPSRR